MADAQSREADDDVPCAPLFATETMAELSARQGRLPDAVAIYRHLVREAEAGGAVDADRLARWKARLAELEGGPAAAAPAPTREAGNRPPPPTTPAIPARAAPVAPSLAAAVRQRPSIR